MGTKCLLFKNKPFIKNKQYYFAGVYQNGIQIFSEEAN